MIYTRCFSGGSGGGENEISLISELPTSISLESFETFRIYAEKIDLSSHTELTEILSFRISNPGSQDTIPALKKVIFPSSLEVIAGANGTGAFLYGYPLMEEIVFNGDPPDLQVLTTGATLLESFFGYNYSTGSVTIASTWRIFVPDSKLNAYLNDEKWSTFSDLIRPIGYTPSTNINEWDFSDPDPWISDNNEIAISDGAIIDNNELIIPNDSATNYVHFNSNDDSFFYNLNKHDIGRHYEYDIEIGSIGDAVSICRLLTFSSDIGASNDASIGIFYYNNTWSLWDGGNTTSNSYDLGISNYGGMSNSNIKIIFEILNYTIKSNADIIDYRVQIIINGVTKLDRIMVFNRFSNNLFTNFYLQIGSHRNSAKGTHIKSFKITKTKY